MEGEKMGEKWEEKRIQNKQTRDTARKNLHFNISFNQDHEEWILRKYFNCNGNFKIEHYMDNLEEEASV